MKNTTGHLKPIVEFLSGYRKKNVTLNLTVYQTGIESKPALRVMRKLAREGLLELIDEGRIIFGHKVGVHIKSPAWRILDRKALADRLNSRKTRRSIRDRLWKAIRIKRIFLLKDIMELADAKEATAMNYIKILERNRYVRKAGRREQRQGQHWQLIRDDGPERPVLKEHPEAPHD